MTHAATSPQPTPLAPPPAGAAGAPPALAPALAWLVQRAALDDETRVAAAQALPDAFAAGAADPGLVLQALLKAGKAAGALRVVACALPPREGVWWAWVAARHACHVAQARADAARADAASGGAPPADGAPVLPPSAAQFAALAAVERWITQPTDEHRRRAWDVAQEAGLETPAGCVAAAAFFTGGSITPAGAPHVPPPAGVHVTMVATATILAAIATDETRLGEIAGAFAQQGVEVVRQLGGWDAAIALARQTFDAQAAQHAEASKPPQLPETR